MKKFMILMLLIFTTLGGSAQTITRDIQREDERVIQTSYETYAVTKGLFKGKYRMSLSCVCQHQDTTYYITPEITLFQPQTISEEAKMLLKLEDGTIITAISFDGVGTTDYKYQVIGTNTFYYIYPSYTIDIHDLELLTNNECIKMRLECNWDSGYFDIDLTNERIKKFYLTKVIKEMYNLIQERFKVNNDVYEGF